MKKRVKLLTTIASLCLAVALMAFGVYAATNASFSIKNKVSFIAEKNVKATVALAVTDWENIHTDISKPANVSHTITPELDNDAASKNWTLFESQQLKPASVEAKQDGNNATMKYTYTVTITNNATTNDTNKYLYIETVWPPERSTVIAPNTATFTATNDAVAVDSEKLKVGEVCIVNPGKIFIYTVSITIDTSADLEATELGFSFSLKAGANPTYAPGGGAE